MKDFRCSNCNKLLAKIVESTDGKKMTVLSEARIAKYFQVEISCPKCKVMNISSTESISPYLKVIEPFNKTMLTFETNKKVETGTLKPDFFTVIEDETDKLTPWKTK